MLGMVPLWLRESPTEADAEAEFDADPNTGEADLSGDPAFHETAFMQEGCDEDRELGDASESASELTDREHDTGSDENQI